MQPVVEALLEDLGEEEAVIAADAVGDGVDAEHGPGDLRSDGVFDSVEVGALVVGGLFLEIGDVGVEFGEREVGDDPVAFEEGRALEWGAKGWRRGLVRAPDEEDALSGLPKRPASCGTRNSPSCAMSHASKASGSE